MTEPAREAGPQRTTQHETFYSLSEAAPLALIRAIRNTLVCLTQSQGLIFLSLAELTHNSEDHRVTITTRDLCAHSHTSESRLKRDTLELESRGLIRVEEGGNHQRNRYMVAWWKTVCVSTLEAPKQIGAFNLEAPKQIGAFNLEAPAPPLWRHGASTLEAPPTENKGVTDDALAVMNLTRETLTMIDQVFSAKAQNHDPTEVRRCQSHLTAFMEKLGTDRDGRRWLDQANRPPACDPDTAARLIAAMPGERRRETWLDALMCAECHPYSYVYFILGALERAQGITTQQSKDGRAVLAAVKRGRMIESSDPATGPQMRDEFKRDLARIAKAKGMDRR